MPFVSPARPLRATVWGVAAGALASLALVPSPLFGIHGVESALVLGLLLPPFAGAIGAESVHELRRLGIDRSAGRILSRAIAGSLLVLAVPTIVLALNALRVRQCDPAEGLAFIALGPGLGVVLAAVTGTASAALVRHRGPGRAVAIGLPIAGALVAVQRFWGTPAVSLHGHYFGWFPGTLYDEEIALHVDFVTFRLVTLAWMIGIALVFSAAWDGTDRRMRLARIRARPGFLLGALALMSAALVAEIEAPRLGHATTSDYIAEQLGKTRHGTRCTVHAPRELPDREVERLVEDCDFRVDQLEGVLDLRQPERVRAFFFRDANEKKRFMGAGRVFVAKPWRNEVYLQLRDWPHPVLAHEVAHVVAGNAAEGLFKIGGRFGGLLPNPALIEGLAVAAAWASVDGLTPHQWARAMLELGKLPKLDDILGLGFMLQPAATAYTAAGSFLRHLLELHGPRAVNEAYRTGDLERTFGRPIASLEREWHALLRTTPLPENALALAKLRYSGRSIFEAVCPHRVAHLRTRLDEDLRTGEPGRIRNTCDEILAIAPKDVRTRAVLVGALAREGAIADAEEQLARLEGPLEAPAPLRVAAREAMGDAAWRIGDHDRARAMYAALLEEPQSERMARTLEVKLIALKAGGREAEVVFELLVGDAALEENSTLGPLLAAELGTLREDGLGPYLEARQLAHHGEHERALRKLEEAERRTLPTERLRTEAERMVGIALFATGRLDRAEAHFQRIADDAAKNEGQRVEARDWLERIKHARRARRHPPQASLP